MSGRRSWPRCWRFTITSADLGRTVDDFDRLLTGELAPAAESDRGAWQLLEQTRFLSAAFRLYETRLIDGRHVDEHVARSQILSVPSARPLRHLVVAVGDRPFDADGYWPADVTMFTTLPGLQRIDLLATDGVLEAGYLDRLRLAFIQIEEASSTPAGAAPVLVIPAEGGHERAAVEDRRESNGAIAIARTSLKPSLVA